MINYKYLLLSNVLRKLVTGVFASTLAPSRPPVPAQHTQNTFLRHNQKPSETNLTPVFWKELIFECILILAQCVLIFTFIRSFVAA